MEKKTYVITISKNFPAHHPKKGEPTNFKEKIEKKLKTHTIRSNYPHWKKIVDKVNAGEAILSVREWSGKPYNSSQVKLFEYEKLGIQPVVFKKKKIGEKHQKVSIQIGQELFTGVSLDAVARRDGFADPQDFIDWFPEELDGCVIHFDDNTY